jgi:hypothetical protein
MSSPIGAIFMGIIVGSLAVAFFGPPAGAIGLVAGIAFAIYLDNKESRELEAESERRASEDDTRRCTGTWNKSGGCIQAARGERMGEIGDFV